MTFSNFDQNNDSFVLSPCFIKNGSLTSEMNAQVTSLDHPWSIYFSRATGSNDQAVVLTKKSAYL